MTDHYWTGSPHSKQQRQTIHASVRGVALDLVTDSGVFSKAQLDYGTRALLSVVELPPAAHAVDLGCGYGPVAAFLSRLYPDSNWTLIDVNDRALALAEENLKSIAHRVQVVHSDGFSGVPDLVADAVLLNPPIRTGKSVIYRLFEESSQHLCENGALWIVIQKKQGAPSAKARLESLFVNVDCVERSAGYHVYKCSNKRI
jgi:16S rRNA (guanine1207-N2)-methyltransferase